MNTREFVQALPKAEMHLHIEGAVPWPLIRVASPDPLPERPPWWADDFRFDDVTGFRGASQLAIRNCLASVEGYARSAAAIFAGLAAQNVRYVELSFDADLVMSRGMAIDAVAATIKQAALAGLTVRTRAAFSQHKVDRLSAALIDAVVNATALDGIDLHGDERMTTTDHFAEAFERARRRGLATRAHAGELRGAESIVTALDALRVTRIAHGVRAIEDDALVKRLVAEGITLDMCPWSNVRLRVVPDLAAHPIRALHRRGVRITVSTDDPTIFGRSLTDELSSLVDDLGFSLADIAQFETDAFEVALINETERAGVVAEIAQLLPQQ